MWRVWLMAIGGYIGFRLARTGAHHSNLVIASVSALLVYKLTQSRMIAEGQSIAGNSNGKKHR